MTDQIRIHRLLKYDPIYKKYFTTPAKLKYPGMTQAPWRIFVQMTPGGPWAKKEYPAYTEAYKTLRKYLPKCHDATINCRPQGFPPPTISQKYKARVKGKIVVRSRSLYAPVPESHSWCPFCRRPVIFKAMRTHGLFSTIHLEEKPVRCTMCGVREEFVKSIFPDYPFSTTLIWPVEVKAK